MGRNVQIALVRDERRGGGGSMGSFGDALQLKLMNGRFAMQGQFQTGFVAFQTNKAARPGILRVVVLFGVLVVVVGSGGVRRSTLQNLLAQFTTFLPIANANGSKIIGRHCVGENSVLPDYYSGKVGR